MNDPIDSDDVRLRARKLIEYLSAVHRTLHSPQRDINSTGQPRWYPADIPDHPGLKTFGAKGWLSISRVERPSSAPTPPTELAVHLAGVDLDDHTREPAIPRDHFTAASQAGPSPEVTAALEYWLEQRWRPWADTAAIAYDARHIYQRLWDLRLRLDNEQDSLELVMGHGLLSWNVDSTTVVHPIVTFPAKITFDDRTATLAVVRDGEGRMERSFLQNLPLGDERALSKLADEFASTQIGPDDDERVNDLYLPFVNAFGPSAEMAEGSRAGRATSRPCLVDTWVIYARKRATEYQRYFERVIASLDGDRPVAPPLASLVAENPSSLPDPWSDSERQRMSTRLLFPKPYNREQQRIAEELANSRGITVQGPPGTGKTHTIANLISHLVAHGKRVLVVSHKPQPLQVLRDRLPTQFQPLCVTDLGDTGRSRDQLGASIEAILEGITSLDPESVRRRVLDNEKRLDRAQAEIEQLTNKLRAIHERDSHKYRVGLDEYSAPKLAKWLSDNEDEISFIPDPLYDAQHCPLGDTEIEEMIALLASISGDDRMNAVLDLPTGMPGGVELDEKWKLLDDIESDLASIEGDIVDWRAIERAGREKLMQSATWFEDQARILEGLNEGWVSNFRNDFRATEAFRESWRQHRTDLVNEVDEIERLGRGLRGKEVEIPGRPTPSPDFVENIRAARARREQGKKLRRRLQKDLVGACESCAVDGHKIDGVAPSVDDLDLVLLLVELRRRRYRLINQWNREAERIGAALFDHGISRVEHQLRPHLERLHHAIDWEDRLAPAVADNAGHIGIRLPENPGSGDLRHSADVIRIATRRLLQQSTEWDLGELEERVETGARSSDGASVWQDLRAAFGRRDALAWHAAVDEAQRLWTIRASAFDLANHLDLLRPITPEWVRDLVAGDIQPGMSADLAFRAWEWRKLETRLSELLNGDDPTELQMAIEAAQSQERLAIAELVTDNAWLRLKESITDQQRSALSAYGQAMRKVGRGTGKFAATHRRSAQQAMRLAQGAVPVWVMPIYRAIEVFDPSAGDRFDVLITDESSQCDVLSVGLLAMAEKMVVVGDDKQISPTMAGKAQQPVFNLIRDFLAPTIPLPNRFDLKASLYDIALSAWPGSIMLKEHFRCLPEIIGFSNQLCYRNEIRPLREDFPDPRWTPIRDIYIKDGYRHPSEKRNVAEQERVVDEIVEITSDPAYAGMTIGVISLLGKEQADEISGRLRDKIGETEFEQRRIRCGDAYSFQGDERDIIFITLVIDADSHGGFSKEDDRQRLNVAASRARHQMVVVRSVKAEDLSINDHRRTFIGYCSDPGAPAKPSGDPLERCKSPLEREVARTLILSGHHVEPEFRVGQYRIDMVVHTPSGARLAVECDGDEYLGPEQWADDMDRQRTLERLGWRFHRIRGSAYYRHPELVMQSLTDTLDRIEAESVAIGTVAPEIDLRSDDVAEDSDLVY